MNMNNFGIINGRMASDPTIFTNKDGSRKIKVSVAAKRNYKNKETGKVDVDFVQLEAFIPASKEGNGAFDYLHKGDNVAFEFAVRYSRYTDKDGKEHFNQVLEIQQTELRGSKRTSTPAEAAAEAAKATPATEAAPADDEELPFN